MFEKYSLYTSDRAGQQIGKYHLHRLLGRGTFAEVYLGEDREQQTQVAVKVLQMQLTEENRKRFQSEVESLFRLKHPHIIRLLDWGVEGDLPYLVMQYAPQRSLRQRYLRGTPLPIATVIRYVQQIASALQYAHEQKIIHRDVKPDNMLLGRHNEILLSDFGLAVISSAHRSSSMCDMAGTVMYTAPEQLQGFPCFASDQYALAVVVYEWLTGEYPFQGNFIEIASKQMMTPPPSLRMQIRSIPPSVEQVVLKALAKDPAQRFPSVRAFADALSQAALQPGELDYVLRFEQRPQRMSRPDSLSHDSTFDF